MITYGQIAFETWVNAIKEDNPKRRHFFEAKWDDLGVEGKERWEKVALAVLAHNND